MNNEMKFTRSIGWISNKNGSRCQQNAFVIFGQSSLAFYTDAATATGHITVDRFAGSIAQGNVTLNVKFGSWRNRE